jgi:hypothetical protein
MTYVVTENCIKSANQRDEPVFAKAFDNVANKLEQCFLPAPGQGD